MAIPINKPLNIAAFILPRSLSLVSSIAHASAATSKKAIPLDAIIKIIANGINAVCGSTNERMIKLIALSDPPNIMNFFLPNLI